MMSIKKHGWILLLVLAGLWGTASAQDPSVCPPNALLSYTRAGAACQAFGRDSLCYGNGAANALGFDGSELTFNTPGDIIPAGETTTVEVYTDNLNDPAYGVVSGRLQMDITDPEGSAMNILIFGNATLENGVPRAVTFPVFSTGTLRIRSEPVFNAPILRELQVRQSAIAHGRTEAGDWLRVTIPGTLQLGWVALDAGNPDGDVNTLAIVAPGTPFVRPFEIMTIRTQPQPALCGDGVAVSGVLMQTPNTEDEVSLTLNGYDLLLAGTAFIEADETATRITMLQGGVNAVDIGYVPGGSMIALPNGEVMPYDRARLLALPGNNLSPRVVVGQPLTADAITATAAAYFAPQPTLVPTPTVNPNACRQFARTELTLKAGPGNFYESNGVVEVGQSVNPVLQNTDADGRIWYELTNGSWVLASAVATVGECEPLPVLDFVEAPPTNTVKMETCETTNGPLRDGQRITFEFTPPAADNYPEIESAVRTDPGRITVETTALNVRATDPILIASDPERWVRIYRASWRAEAGTYRVESRRLSYILICSLTVQAG